MKVLKLLIALGICMQFPITNHASVHNIQIEATASSGLSESVVAEILKTAADVYFYDQLGLGVQDLESMYKDGCCLITPESKKGYYRVSAGGGLVVISILNGF